MVLTTRVSRPLAGSVLACMLAFVMVTAPVPAVADRPNLPPRPPPGAALGKAESTRVYVNADSTAKQTSASADVIRRMKEYRRNYIFGPATGCRPGPQAAITICSSAMISRTTKQRVGTAVLGVSGTRTSASVERVSFSM